MLLPSFCVNTDGNCLFNIRFSCSSHFVVDNCNILFLVWFDKSLIGVLLFFIHSNSILLISFHMVFLMDFRISLFFLLYSFQSCSCVFAFLYCRVFSCCWSSSTTWRSMERNPRKWSSVLKKVPHSSHLKDQWPWCC